MKYIRSFFESIGDNIIDDCKSLLLDLSDVGFEVTVGVNNRVVWPSITDDLKISIKKESFRSDDIVSYLEVVNDYLASNGLRYYTWIYASSNQLHSLTEEYNSIKAFSDNKSDINYCEIYFVLNKKNNL